MYLSIQKRGKKTENNNSKASIKVSTIFFVLSISVPFLVLILRDESVGLDYGPYINLYNRFFSHTLLPTDASWVSFGYTILTKICIFLFHGNYYYFFGIIGFITLYCFYKTIYQESEFPWMSLLLLFSFCLYYQMFNQFRQMLAIAITFYGFKYLKNRDLKKYIVIILIAFSIHKSAIIMLPCYWLGNLKLHRKSIIFYIIVSIFVYLLYDSFESVILNTSYGQKYLASSYYNVVEGSSMINLFFRMTLFIFCYYLINRRKENTYDTNLLQNLCFACVVLQIMTIKSYVFGRMTTYFFVYFILLVPKAIKSIRVNRNSKFLVNTAFLICCIIYHSIYFITKASPGFGVGIYKFFFMN